MTLLSNQKRFLAYFHRIFRKKNSFGTLNMSNFKYAILNCFLSTFIHPEYMSQLRSFVSTIRELKGICNVLYIFYRFQTMWFIWKLHTNVKKKNALNLGPKPVWSVYKYHMRLACSEGFLLKKKKLILCTYLLILVVSKPYIFMHTK